MKNYLYMILAAICLGTIGVLIKLIGNSIPFMTLNFFRVFFGFVFLLITVPFIDKTAFKLDKKNIKPFFLIGVIYAIALSLYNVAMLYAPIQNIVLLNYTYPFFVLVFAYFLLKEKITSTKIITLLIALVGLVIINPFKGGEYLIGHTLVLAGAILYAILITEMRKENSVHTIGAVLWFFLFASVVLAPFPFIYGIGEISKVFHYVLALGFVSTGLAYLFYNLALEKIEAEVGSIISTVITPIVSILLAVLVISEQINVRIIVGGALLIIAGIYLELHNREFKK